MNNFIHYVQRDIVHQLLMKVLSIFIGEVQIMAFLLVGEIICCLEYF